MSNISYQSVVDKINQLITDIYECRKIGMANGGEGDINNLVFKEFRNRGYLDKLKDLRNETLSKALSLESLDTPAINEARLMPKELDSYRIMLKRACNNEVVLNADGNFFIYLVKESDVQKDLRNLKQLDIVNSVVASPTGKYDFSHIDFIRKTPSQYYTIRGTLKD